MSLQFETWPVDRLKAYGRNPRKNDHVVDQMVGAIQEFGFRIPIVARSDGTVVDGHLRLKAAQKLGLNDVPVVLADDLTDAQVKAFRLLANRSANWADWDDDLLRLEFDDLIGFNFDLALTGFDEPELADLFADKTGGMTGPDDVPDAPAFPASRMGDLWQCGNHRVMCGDSTDAETVTVLLGGAKPELMVTDPPYGIGYSYAGHDDKDNSRNADLVRAVFDLAPDAAVWTPGLNNLARDISRFGKTKVLVWSKKFAQAGSGLGGASTWEPILVLGKTPQAKLANDLIEIMTERETLNGVNLRDLHSCPKPVALYALLINAFAKKSSKLYEPFLGSGTTMIAGEMTGRQVYGMEMSPAYVDVNVTRWQAFTGKSATLEGDGRTFEEVRNERQEFQAAAE